MTGRQEIRDAIFNAENSKPKSRVIDFLGAKIELRQPTLVSLSQMRSVADVKSEQDPDRPEEISLVRMVISNTYVPGTDELVFTDDDYEMLSKLPFGPDLNRLSAAVNELTGIDVREMAKNSDATQ